MASRKHDPKSDAGSWVLIAVLFLVGLWPIALAVLLFKLFGRDGQKRRVPPPLEQQEMPGSIPTPVKKRGTGPVTPVKRKNRAQTAARQVTRSPAAKTSTARVLKIVGVVITVVSLLACWEPIDMMIWLGELDWWSADGAGRRGSGCCHAGVRSVHGAEPAALSSIPGRHGKPGGVGHR